MFAFGASSASIFSLVGISPTLSFAFGGRSTASGQAGFRFDGTRWAPMTPDIPAVNVAYSTFHSSEGAIFVGGIGADSLPVIVRGARRN